VKDKPRIRDPQARAMLKGMGEWFRLVDTLIFDHPETARRYRKDVGDVIRQGVRAAIFFDALRRGRNKK